MTTIEDIKLKDIEKRRLPAKYYAYIIDVTWSDGRVLEIGRAYSDFFEFQMALLEQFPAEGGQRDPTKRIIPFLPGKSLFRRSNTREYALKRMGPISEYCTGISKMPRYILDTKTVEEFFLQNEEDRSNQGKRSGPLSPDIKPDTSKANEISGPMILDKFIAIADYKKENKKELNLKSGQVVEVVEKSDNGWWLAASEEGMTGWVPAAYLESLYGEGSQATESKRVKPGEGEMFEAVNEFSSESSDELTFEVGDILEILEKNTDGWWYGKMRKGEGWVPGTYLQKSSVASPLPTQQEKPSEGEQKSKWIKVRHAVSATKKPPPKRSTIRRTLTKAAVAKVQVDFKAKYLQTPQNAIGEGTEDEDIELGETYLTIDKFDSTIPDGLSFAENDYVHIIRKSSAGWWYGRVGNKRGWVPESYLAKRSSPSHVAVPKIPAPPKPMRQQPSPKEKPDVPQKPFSRKDNNIALEKAFSSRPKTPETPKKSKGDAPSSPKPPRPPAPKMASPALGHKGKPITGPKPLTPSDNMPNKRRGFPLPATPLQNGKKESDLSEYLWYRDVSRQEAEGALLCEGQEGYFIVRPSARGAKKDKPYSLTLHHQKINWNFHIRLRHDKKYAIGIYKEHEACFSTLPELVEHYKKNSLIIGDEERKVALVDSPSELYAAC